MVTLNYRFNSLLSPNIREKMPSLHIFLNNSTNQGDTKPILLEGTNAADDRPVKKIIPFLINRATLAEEDKIFQEFFSHICQFLEQIKLR